VRHALPRAGKESHVSADLPFWKAKPLAAMSDAEWESLCDGCGRCCLVKLEEDLDDPDGEPPPRGVTATAALTPAEVARRGPGAQNPRIFYTDVRCRLLDGDACRCRDYDNRMASVHDCVRLTPETVAEIGWLPPTCGYRLLSEGRDLYWWHPLLSGDPDSVHIAGVSVRGRARYAENELSVEAAQERLVSWPVRVPKAARAKGPQRKA
jgi:uncharacterized cysteine cluster protein YcgN (CxxCxxCC family)